MKTVFGVLLLATAACGLSLVLASSCSSRTTSTPSVRDPGPGRAADVQGLVKVKTFASIQIHGKDIRLPSRGIAGGCEAATNPCYGFVLLARDGYTADRVLWWRPESGNRYSLSTNVFRLEGPAVVVDGGVSVPLSDRFVIRGCETNTRPALATAAAGVTLYLDGRTAKVTIAACNGMS